LLLFTRERLRYPIVRDPSSAVTLSMRIASIGVVLLPSRHTTHVLLSSFGIRGDSLAVADQPNNMIAPSLAVSMLPADWLPPQSIYRIGTDCILNEAGSSQCINYARTCQHAENVRKVVINSLAHLNSAELI